VGFRAAWAHEFPRIVVAEGFGQSAKARPGFDGRGFSRLYRRPKGVLHTAEIELNAEGESPEAPTPSEHSNSNCLPG
jgi:hypothetical protein